MRRNAHKAGFRPRCPARPLDATADLSVCEKTVASQGRSRCAQPFFTDGEPRLSKGRLIRPKVVLKEPHPYRLHPLAPGDAMGTWHRWAMGVFELPSVCQTVGGDRGTPRGSRVSPGPGTALGLVPASTARIEIPIVYP
jgi:hypothetical protein